MLLTEISLSVIWIIILFFILRLFYKSGNLHLNSNRIFLSILGIISFGIIRHFFMNFIQNFYEINFPIGLIFNTSIVCILPILCYLYVKKTISNDDTMNSSDIIHFVVFIIFYTLYQLPYKSDVTQIEILSQEDIYWANYFNAKKIPNWLITVSYTHLTLPTN